MQWLVLAACVVLSAAGLAGMRVLAAGEEWKSDWAVPEGFALQIDTGGYEFPTAIAFVPNPGRSPNDPLYFVTELRGKVKVVTNDRTVYTFAENFFQLKPTKELPEQEGEVGLAGLCLDPDHGYVFATFAYQDRSGTLRNDIARFQSVPKIFSLKPTAFTRFSDIFAGDVSGVSHQIGACQIQGGAVYVGVGEGWQPPRSRQLHSTLGKILRMTVDGMPVRSNPFYQNDDRRNARNYVWAYGLRNPFSLKVVGDRVFVADNGTTIDRFMEVQKGGDYLWDGSDWSFGTNAHAVLAPSVGPVQMDFYSGQPPLFPQKYAGSFFVASTGLPEVRRKTGIIRLRYGFKDRRMVGVHEYVVRYRSEPLQILVGAAFGPDALYIVPLFPWREGKSSILKVLYDPARQHPYALERERSPFTLIERKGCLSCHKLQGVGETRAPLLDREPLLDRLQKRLHSQAYLDRVQELDRSPGERSRAFREARREVLAATGLERVRVWVRHQIQTPGFDNPGSQMPTLGVSDEEAAIIVAYLLRPEGRGGRIGGLLRRLRSPELRVPLVAFMVGLASGVVLLTLVRAARIWRGRP